MKPLILPLIAFLLFVLYVEGVALYNRLKRYSADITRTFGHADRIYRGERGWREGKGVCKQLI